MKTTIVYDHRNRAKGEGPLELRITNNGAVYYIATGIRVLRSEWKHDEVVNRDDCDQLNRRLTALRKRLDDELSAWIETGEPLDIAEIKRRITSPAVKGEEKPGTDMYDWMKVQVEQLTLREGTVKHYITLIARMREYGRMMAWDDLTTENIYQWDSWLHRLKKPATDAGRKAGVETGYISDAAVYNYHKCLKALIARAVRFGIADKNPYERLRGVFKRGERDTVDYLTADEMKAIEQIRPTPGSTMAVVRDLFVFQMYTGMSFSDMQRFDIGDYRMENGQWVTVRERTKTGVAFISQLLPPVVEVLGRYGMQLPEITNQKYNELLKYLGEVAGIRKRITSHMARHTFATWALHNKVELHVVSQMLGHTNTTMTQRYAKTLGVDVRAAFDELKRRYNSDVENTNLIN